MKKRRQQAAEAAALEAQEDEIRQMFKRQRITEEMGQVQGGKRFKPITRWMAPAARAPAEPTFRPADEEEGPDYGIEEEEEEEEWPVATSIEDEEEEEVEEMLSPPPSLRKEWESPQPTEWLEETHETNTLRSISSLITKFKKRANPSAERVKDPKSPLHGYSLQDLQRVKEEILARRQGKVLPAQLQASRKLLKKTPQKEKPQKPAASPMERA